MSSLLCCSELKLGNVSVLVVSFCKISQVKCAVEQVVIFLIFGIILETQAAAQTAHAHLYLLSKHSACEGVLLIYYSGTFDFPATRTQILLM